MSGADDREVAPRLADPALDAAGDEASGGGDAHTSTPGSRRPVVDGQPEDEVRVLHRLAGGALAEVVERADHDRAAGRAVLEERDLGGVGALHARELRRDALGEDDDGVAPGVGRLEPLAQVAGERARVAGGDEAALDGQEVRDEADGEAQRLLDLGGVLVAPDLVRRHVLEDVARVRLGLQPAPGAGDAGLGVDDDALRVDRLGERQEREQHRGRVAAGARDEPAGGRQQLGERVAPVDEPAGIGVREAVPLLVRGRARQPVAAGEVDDDALGGRLEPRRLLVPEAEEDDVGAARERLLVR